MYTKVLVLVSTLFAIFVNSLAVLLPLNNKTTQELSDAIPTLFTPAGYVFSIWGVIYLGMISFSVYQFVSKTEVSDKTNAAFILSNFANAAWIFAWHFQLVYVSVLIMLVLLFSLIYVYKTLPSLSLKGSLAAKLPISIYLGWISVATIANIAAALYVANWNGFGIEHATWSIIMIAVASVLGLVMLYRNKDIAFAAVLVWSFFGIYNKFVSVENLRTASLLMVIILIIAICATVTKKYSSIK